MGNKTFGLIIVAAKAKGICFIMSWLIIFFKLRFGTYTLNSGLSEIELSMFSKLLTCSSIFCSSTTSLKFVNSPNIVLKSIGNFTLPQSSNSTTPFWILSIFISICLKSTSVSSKKESSTPSSSATLATPLTSISLLESKHIPKTLWNILYALVLSLSSSYPTGSFIAPKRTWVIATAKSTLSKILMVP